MRDKSWTSASRHGTLFVALLAAVSVGVCADAAVSHSHPSSAARARQSRASLNAALLWEAHCGHVRQVQRLLAQGADINSQDMVGLSVLSNAVTSGNLSCVRMLLAHGAAINARQGTGRWTALMTAARVGSVPTVLLLLISGAQREALDADGDTALMVAIRNRRLAVVRTLLNHGASLRFGDRSPIQAALVDRDGRHDEPIVKMLISCGALYRGQGVNATDGLGMTALMYAAFCDDAAWMQRLLDQGADIEVKEGLGNTALVNMVWNGDVESARFLVEHGASLQARINSGEPLVVGAAIAGSAPMVAYLLDKGASVNERDRFGRTLLMMASLHKDIALVRLLLARGADLAAKDKDGETALTLARVRPSGWGSFYPTSQIEAAVHLLMTAGAKP